MGPVLQKNLHVQHICSIFYTLNLNKILPQAYVKQKLTKSIL